MKFRKKKKDYVVLLSMFRFDSDEWDFFEGTSKRSCRDDPDIEGLDSG